MQPLECIQTQTELYIHMVDELLKFTPFWIKVCKVCLSWGSWYHC